MKLLSKELVMNSFSDYIILVAWWLVGFVDPAYPFVTGSIIFYVWQIDKGKRHFNFAYLILLGIVSIIIGSFVSDLVAEFLPANHKNIEASVLFFIGIFGKMLLDLALSEAMVDAILNKISRR